MSMDVQTDSSIGNADKTKDQNKDLAASKINSFELLGLTEQGTSLRDIRVAFHKKSRLYHPDAGGKVEDFLNLKRAFDILCHPLKREAIGALPLFKRPLLRIKPSMSKTASQLFENLSVLQERLKKTSSGNGGAY